MLRDLGFCLVGLFLSSCHSFTQKSVCLSHTIDSFFEESQVSTNGATACAVHNGALYCWGGNGSGELGNGTTGGQNQSPSIVTGLESNVRAVRVGGLHTAGTLGFVCALQNCSVKCWGRNAEGELGNNTTTASNTPVQALGLSNASLITSLGIGGGHGSFSPNYHNCIISNGAAQCWGKNGLGQLGNGSTTNSSTPVQVSGLTSGVTSITVGSGFSCAVVTGAAKCWGNNAQGELGDGQVCGAVSCTTPTQVQGLTSGVTAIYSGNKSACALVNSSVWCWGLNDGGEFGNGTTAQSTTPIQISQLASGVTKLALGVDTYLLNEVGFACGIINGGVKCWGAGVTATPPNQNGVLGNGTNDIQQLTPNDVTGLGAGSAAVSLSAGMGAACVMLSSGTVKCWGDNSFGQLGASTSNVCPDGGNLCSTTPLTVSLP